MALRKFIATTIREYLREQQEVLLAPNGNKSNLPPHLYKLVRTSEFKRWFGDWENDPKNASKVVDGNGEPLVVVHGTSEMDFIEFRSYVEGDPDYGFPGMFFSDKDLGYGSDRDNRRVIHAFIKSKRLRDVRANNPTKLNQKIFDKVCDEFQVWWLDNVDEVEMVDEAGDVIFKPGKSLDKLSYDGLILPNTYDVRNYLVFDSSQIKVVSYNG